LLHQNGRLIGYYVGYKRCNSSSPYLYISVPATDAAAEAAAAADDDDSASVRCQIDELDKYTSYGVHVQAYNAKGAGPRSTDVIVRTLEDGITPSLCVISIQLNQLITRRISPASN